jgi:hypothetical protein
MSGNMSASVLGENISQTVRSCAFCYEPGHNILNCKSPEIVQLCGETREHAYYAYLLKNENILLDHLRTYPYNALKVLYMHWKATGTPDFRQRANVPDFPPVLSYSCMVALNMWLYLYIELHQMRYTGTDDQYRDITQFWYNAWNGNIIWYTSRHIPYDDDDDDDDDDSVVASELSSDFAPDTVDTSTDVPSSLVGGMRDVASMEGKFEIQLSSKNVASAHECNECPICFDGVCFEKKVLLNCGHTLCSDCFQTYITSKHSANSSYMCSMCRAHIGSVVVFCPDVETNLTKCLSNHTNDALSHGLLDLIDSVEFDMNLFYSI